MRPLHDVNSRACDDLNGADLLCTRVQSPFDQPTIGTPQSNDRTDSGRGYSRNRIVHLGVGDISMLAIYYNVLEDQLSSRMYTVALTSKPQPATVLAVHAEESIMNVPYVG